MSVTPVDFVFEGEKLLVALIYDLYVKKFGGGSISADDTTTDSIIAANAADLRRIYVEGILSKFGDQQTSTGENFSSFCTTVDQSNPSARQYNFFEMCVAMANIIFNVDGINENFNGIIATVPIYLGLKNNSVFRFLCDFIYSYKYPASRTPAYAFFGKNIAAVQYVSRINFTNDLNPTRLISDGMLSKTTIEQLKKVNGELGEERGIEHGAPEPTEEPPLKVVTEDGATKSADEESWLSHSPTKCERVWTDVLLAIILAAGPATISLTAFNSMFDFMPKLIFSHLSSTADWGIGIAAGVLALGFTALDLFRIIFSSYQHDIFDRIDCYEKCGCCKAFWFRVVGAHRQDDCISMDHIGGRLDTPFVSEGNDQLF
jgi:hypothetical protein